MDLCLINLFSEVSFITSAVMEMSQLVCGGCRTLLMYAPGANGVRCACCNTINLTRSGMYYLFTLLTSTPGSCIYRSWNQYGFANYMIIKLLHEIIYHDSRNHMMLNSFCWIVLLVFILLSLLFWNIEDSRNTMKNNIMHTNFFVLWL